MCRSTIEPGSVSSSPCAPTIRVAASLPRERPSAIGLSDGPFAKAAIPELPKGDHTSLLVLEGPSQGEEFEITKSITTIGRRGGGADFEIDGPTISRAHCAVEIRRDGVLLHDLRSTNGTYLRNSGVSVVRLEPMSTFRIGTSLLQLKAT
jgi:hypothetical protein